MTSPRAGHGIWRRTLATATAAWLLALGAGPASASVVEVAVTGVRDTRGDVRVDICTRDTFLRATCPYEGMAPATVGATVVKVAGVPPGLYAAQAFHDVTGEGHVHQNVLGIPREGIGFSNDAPLRVRGPRFQDAAFSVGGPLERITLKLKHLFGR